MTKLTPPLKYHGGKQYLAKRIIELMPPRCYHPNEPATDDPGWLHYVEPYFGGGAVLLAQDPEGISEVANDIDGNLMRFWGVLQRPDQFGYMMRILETTPFSQVEWKAAVEIAKLKNDAVYGAAAFFIHCRQSMAGRMDSFAPLTRTRTRRGMNEQASAWLNCIEGLPAVHERLKRVVILNQDAVKVIKQQDGPRTLFYLDPPYLHETRAATDVYANEMTEAQHIDLLTCLATVEGRFLLSGYPSKLYLDWAEMRGWRRVDIEIDNKAASGATKRKMTECIWMNY